MIKIYVTKTCVCPTKSPLIKSRLRKILKEKEISDASVSVAIVGRPKMLNLAKKFLNEDNILHNVLSFTESEVADRFPLVEEGYLGEIVICYPKVMDEANAENKMVDEKLLELVEHGALHLLGVHHI